MFLILRSTQIRARSRIEKLKKARLVEEMGMLKFDQWI